MNRRHFLQTSALAIGLSSLPGQTLSPAGRVVDAHTHFYDPTRPEGVPWPTKGTPLYRKVTPEDWQKLAHPLGIKETIVVEASPWVEDNQWILDLANQEKGIVGFVGNLNPHDAQFKEHLKRFAAHPVFRGIRWRGDLARLEGFPAIVNAAQELAKLDLSLDLNSTPATLPQAHKLAASVPDLRIIINHLGSAGDPQNISEEWRENVLQASKQPNVFMKVSALAEQAKAPDGQAPREVDYYLPILSHLWDCFGQERLIYGSNWPVSDRGAPYEIIFKLVSEFFHSKGPEAAEKYFWKNSQAAYHWKERA